MKPPLSYDCLAASAHGTCASYLGTSPAKLEGPPRLPTNLKLQSPPIDWPTVPVPPPSSRNPATTRQWCTNDPLNMEPAIYLIPRTASWATLFRCSLPTPMALSYACIPGFFTPNIFIQILSRGSTLFQCYLTDYRYRSSFL